jgi:hypothetical protein
MIVTKLVPHQTCVSPRLDRINGPINYVVFFWRWLVVAVRVREVVRAGKR